MRFNKSHRRVLDIITDPVIPRRADGHICLCEFCQREASWCGGFLKMLARDLEYRGKWHRSIVAARKRAETQQQRA